VARVGIKKTKQTSDSKRTEKKTNTKTTTTNKQNPSRECREEAAHSIY
jgi:hypothetical protein